MNSEKISSVASELNTFQNKKYLQGTRQFLQSNSMIAKLAFLILVVFVFDSVSVWCLLCGHFYCAYCCLNVCVPCVACYLLPVECVLLVLLHICYWVFIVFKLVLVAFIVCCMLRTGMWLFAHQTWVSAWKSNKPEQTYKQIVREFGISGQRSEDHC